MNLTRYRVWWHEKKSSITSPTPAFFTITLEIRDKVSHAVLLTAKGNKIT